MSDNNESKIGRSDGKVRLSIGLTRKMLHTVAISIGGVYANLVSFASRRDAWMLNDSRLWARKVTGRGRLVIGLSATKEKEDSRVFIL